MYELRIYIKFAILYETDPSIIKLVYLGESYPQASHFVINMGDVEVYRHVNAEDCNVS